MIEKEPVIGEALQKYIAARGQGFERKVESKILTDAAPFLSEFIARLFKIGPDREDLSHDITVQNPVWRYKFFVQRRAVKKFKPEQLAELNEAELWHAVTDLRNTAFDETLIHDEELSISEITCRLLDAEEFLKKEHEEKSSSVSDTIARINKAYEAHKDSAFGKAYSSFVVAEDATGDRLAVRAALAVIEAWTAAAFASKSRKWYSFKVPHALNYQNLVHLIHPIPELS